jgi:hypothetical protein
MKRVLLCCMAAAALMSGALPAGAADAARPKPGCAQIADPAGDATLLADTLPTRPPGDPALDFLGWSLHRTASRIEVDLSVAKLQLPSSQALAARYEIGFQLGLKRLSGVIEWFGPLQPVREQIPRVVVPKPLGFTLYDVPTRAAVGNTAIPATAVLDTTANVVMLSMDRRALESALGKKFIAGAVLYTPFARSRSDLSDVVQPAYDTVKAESLRLAKRDKCF